jgi:hypothetical protein
MSVVFNELLQMVSTLIAAATSLIHRYSKQTKQTNSVALSPRANYTD